MLIDKKKLKEYYIENNVKYVVTIDFDHTLCDSNYPDCGEEIKEICDYMRYLQTSPYVEIILCTCRNGDSLISAINWCNEHDIYLDEINRQGFFDSTKYTESRKIFCNMSIDDTSYNFNIDDFKNFNNDKKGKN